jgi:hypothetical protein
VTGDTSDFLSLKASVRNRFASLFAEELLYVQHHRALAAVIGD